MSIAVYTASTWQKTGLVVMARLVNILGSAVTQASLDTITCKVYDMERLAPLLITSPTVTVAATISDTYVTTDARWTTDAIGYNFIFTLAASCFPLPHTYRVEFKFTPVGQDSFPLVIKVPCSPLLSF